MVFSRLAYLSHLDIRSIPCLKDETLLAVKAPYGSTLEVPDPDEVAVMYKSLHLIGHASGKEKV